MPQTAPLDKPVAVSAQSMPRCQSGA
jgi:hypothetical protein